MMEARWYHRLPASLALWGLLLVGTSSLGVEQRFEPTMEGPSATSDGASEQRNETTDQPAMTAAQSMPPEPFKVTVTEAVLLSLENNLSLEVQRLNPAIRQTFEDQERAVFDLTIGAAVSAGRIEGERLARSGSETEDFTADSAEGGISLEQYFPTGTTVGLEAGKQMTDSSLYDDRFYETRLGLTASQALLQGFGREVNLVRLRQARLDTRMSEYELRGFSQSLVAEVERTYWNYALARRRIEIVEESLRVARQQLAETKQLIAVGRLARVEASAVQAEVAAQEQALIEAKASKESIRLQLLRLLNPTGTGVWQREVDLIHQPTLPDIKLEDVELHVAVSKRMRPILNEARLEILRGDLEIVQTKNGLLPQLDLFITLGKSGYANSFNGSVNRIDDDSYDALGGIRFGYPLYNRDAKALHRRALLNLEQAQKALDNLSQLVEVDVRTAHIEVNRTKQQITASSVTRKFDEEKLRTETERLRVGKSTSFLVAQAQRDVLVSRIAEVQSIANYLKALITLYQQDGSLLERRAIAAPGQEPVELSNK